MRKISASYIFTGKGEFLKNGILIFDNKGFIVDILDTNGKLTETQSLEQYNGILCPGFVNAHCHLELSYLRGMLDKTQNIAGFIKQMLQKKNNFKGNVFEEILRADNELTINGIVACGDISNTTDSFVTKCNSKIKYYNFIEVLGFLKHESIIEKAKQIAQSAILINAGLTSISPHASYSVSPNLFSKIKQIAEENNSIISFHNQESIEENDLFANKKNELYLLLQNLGITSETFPITGKSSFSSLISYLPSKNNILLVHNVFTKNEDILLAKKYLPNRFWVFCPKSNLYISNTLPNIELFKNENDKICIGTDSLASNNSLSIIDELKVLQQNFPQISISNLLQWATLNGAKALQIQNEFGSFEIGKKPGINLIYDLNLPELKFTKNTKVKKIS